MVSYIRWKKNLVAFTATGVNFDKFKREDGARSMWQQLGTWETYQRLKIVYRIFKNSIPISQKTQIVIIKKIN
jgi:hypothetical protein